MILKKIKKEFELVDEDSHLAVLVDVEDRGKQTTPWGDVQEQVRLKWLVQQPPCTPRRSQRRSPSQTARSRLRVPNRFLNRPRLESLMRLSMTRRQASLPAT
jgi:hypothetical protein